MTTIGAWAMVAAVLAGGRAPDACQLLTDEDVRAVQGQPVAQRVPSTPPARTFRVVQCVYQTPQLTDSVSVAVTGPLPGGPTGTARAYWKERFAAGASPPRKKDPPRAVPGLGDEAFWVGDRVTGALYVLKGDAFVRISVGGVPEEAARLERTKTLASLAVQRLGER